MVIMRWGWARLAGDVIDVGTDGRVCRVLRAEAVIMVLSW
jgi:hypothetical protein